MRHAGLRRARDPQGQEVRHGRRHVGCGVIVYILLGGYPPFHDDNHAILYRKIKAADYAFDPQYWDQVSDDAKDLIKKMLLKCRVDPSTSDCV